MHYILASGSPRRKELLRGLGIEFEVRLLPDIDESYDPSLPGEEIAKTISRKKAEAYRPTLSANELIITADTIVYLDGEVLGKPKDEEEARKMLRKLSGRTHEVITGVTLLGEELSLHPEDSESRNIGTTFASVSRVTFAQLSEAEIDYYVTRFRPLDKAGAYGIQEWIGFVGVERIEGSYFNVMGLPVQKLYSTLKEINAI